ISTLDAPLADDNGPQVIYLRYADAEAIAKILNDQTAASARGGGQGAQATRNDSVSIIPDIDNNALIISAAPKKLRSIKDVITKLDIRRAQVQVEALIVEVSADKSAQLGITWAFDGTVKDIGAGLTNFPATGAGVAQIGEAVQSGGLSSSVIPAGGTFVFGRIKDNGNSIAAVLSALAGDGFTNVLSTPNITTLDNKEAEIKIGQKVPFLTGNFTNTGASGGGSLNPFQTLNREDVGITLKVKPQINQGGSAVQLEIEGVISSLGAGADPTSGLATTNERSIVTNVIAEDGEIIVLGGLIDDQLLESIQRVPLLSNVPLLGQLFKSRSTTKVKRNLMIFLRPSILKDSLDANESTMEKYYYIRDEQMKQQGNRVQLMPYEERSVLPELEQYKEDLSDKVMP
ncbi:MAG: type II secretion system protein GspD, partial [Gammaproteobacteria bacterium]|nr:type II secretion system protein GspD [Gammaproteobacteria bacterium]